MITKDVTIDIKQATDASPVAKCVQLASQFKSKIYIENGATKVNHGNDGIRNSFRRRSKSIC